MDRGLLSALVQARRSAAACTFEVTAEGVTTKLVLAAGNVVAVEESGAGEPLGRVLVRKRLLTQDQYVEVLERMTAAIAAGEQLRFGEIAVGLGFLTEEQTRSALTEQIRGRAMRMLSRGKPTWTEQALPANRDASRDLTLSLEALVLDALRLTDDEVKRESALAAVEGRALFAAWPIEEIDERFELTPEEAVLARRALSGTVLVEDLLRTPFEEVDGHALFAALLVTGAAEPRARAETAVQMSAASAPTRTRAIPQPLPEWATIDTARAKGAMDRKLSHGTMTAVDVADVERRLRAEQTFQRGKALLRQGRGHEAVVELSRASELEEGNAEYLLYARWSAHAESKEPLSTELADELATLADAALAASPSLAFGHFVRGELARSRGDEEGARRHLRHALRLEPGLFASERALRTAAMRARPSSPDLGDGSTVPPPSTKTVASPPSPSEGSVDPVVVMLPRPDPTRMPSPVPPPASAEEAAGEAPSAVASAPAKTEAPRPLPSSPAAPRSSLRVVAPALAMVCLGVAAYAWFRPATAPPSTPSTRTETLASQPPPTAPRPSAPVPASASASPSAPASASASASAPAPAPASASASPSASVASASPSASPSPTGTLLVPAGSVGRRFVLDGKLLGDATARMTVPCGHHVVRLGKSGKDTPVEVPCGGELPVAP